MPAAFSHDRCATFIAAVDHPTEVASAAVVLAAIDTHGINYADFMELDARPGQFNGYRDHTWHAALRRVRNANNDLFERLNTNS